MPTEPQPGTLYIVGTPIGNLEDITYRAVRVLQNVDLIAAEDTRHTGKLLHHFQVKAPQISYHDHNRHSRHPEILEHLTAGKAIALVTDAGMPGISDPGYELVIACIEANIPVVPIPGVSAVTTAVSASGLPSDRFIFEGFLPVKGQERISRLDSLASEARTIIIYESPHRLQQTIKDLTKVLGIERKIVLARELTKLYEEFWRGTLEEAATQLKNKEPQGEYTLLVAGTPTALPYLSAIEIESELKAIMLQKVSRSQASRQLAKVTAHSRQELYQIALTIVMDDTALET
jgi:16S rRNA (cytidine1402-2'-O)-methyltransferase